MSVSAFPYGLISQVTAPSDTITLSGTTGSPNLSSQSATSPSTATAQWSFDTLGRVFRYLFGSSSQFQDGIEWNGSQDSPTGSYWIRATLYSGASPTSGTLGSWLKVSGSGSSTRTWTWFQSGLGTKDGILKIEIANDSGGSTIVATGYYRGLAQVSI